MHYGHEYLHKCRHHYLIHLRVREKIPTMENEKLTAAQKMKPWLGRLIYSRISVY